MNSRTPEMLSPHEPLRLMRAEQLVRMEHPPIRQHWGHLITDRMLGMVYAARGSGKTFFAVGLCVSIASGKPFLGNKPSEPRRVVYLDGEMGSVLMSKRLKETQASLGARHLKRIKVLAPDLCPRSLPSLATRDGQREIDRLIPTDTEVIVVDNMSSWNRGGREDAEGWGTWLDWMLRHKHSGRTIIIVHHANKNGGQRGTSAREDQLDFTIALSPKSVQSQPGALSFRLTWEKLRSIGQAHAAPMDVTRVEDEKTGKITWQHQKAESTQDRYQRAVQLRAQGQSLSAIAKQIGVDKSTVSRMLRHRA
jgi:putative DNA primase/helicase